jgi:hypothetical protein
MNNGTYFTVGLERGAYLETGSTSSGTAYGDLSGSTITITGMEKISSLEVMASLIELTRYTFWWEWTGDPNNTRYIFANTSIGPTLTSQESAALARQGYDEICVSGIGTGWQGRAYWVNNYDNPINASPTNPIPVLGSTGGQFYYAQQARYQYMNYTVFSPIASNFCDNYQSEIYQMEIGDIGGYLYFTNATLLYTI